MNSEPHNNGIINFRLTVKSDRISLFSPLFGQGFNLIVRTGISVKNLLCQQFYISEDYLDQRIQTIFLDGKVVDNVETTIIQDGSTLALSAAMPGLAGATLRRGGIYAAMRKEISHNDRTSNDSTGNGSVMIKLFNMVALELGPIFLERGIRIDGARLEKFFQKVPDVFWDGCSNADIDGKPVDVREISLMEWRNRQILLKLKVED